jgi:CRP/FNR family transcriptional regulator, cyclic AMP receptor protein
VPTLQKAFITAKSPVPGELDSLKRATVTRHAQKLRSTLRQLAIDFRRKTGYRFPVKPLLCSVPIFAGLDDKALKIFLEHAKKIVVPDGGVIAREGEVNHCMFLIESGSVRIIKNFNTPDAVTLAVLGPGEFFGEMCILETLPRAATGQAAGRTTVASVASSAFYHLYQKMPEQHSILLLNIARDLSRRLRHLDEVFAARH